jgi:hypothetical protein
MAMRLGTYGHNRFFCKWLGHARWGHWGCASRYMGYFSVVQLLSKHNTRPKSITRVLRTLHFIPNTAIRKVLGFDFRIRVLVRVVIRREIRIVGIGLRFWLILCLILFVTLLQACVDYGCLTWR